MADNRQQRRHRPKPVAADTDRAAEEARRRAEQQSLYAHERPPDEYSVRAKSTGHGKMTADKWNQ